ncbi:MAG: class I SAM-dependent methyltransferase [Blastocatellia bacterium]
MNTIERFSNRVENYVKYRPGYPPEVLGFFRDNLGLTESSKIADVGSGTGLSSKLFLENGNTVYGVEPNAKMRDAAAQYLRDFSNFQNIDGLAEATTLPECTVDFVTAAQAFHWFDPEKTRGEFRRILKPGGYIALIWNERQLNTTPFLTEYEKFLLRFANDYTKVRHENVNEEILKTFFQSDFCRATFQNQQIFDFEGLKGRLLSSSYMTSEAVEVLPAMIGELEILFAKHAENDRITVFYDTNIFYTQF